MINDKTPWITHSSEYSYQNKYFKIKTSRVTTPGGQPGTYGVIEILPAVTIVALNEEQEFCLIREFRYPHQRWLWSLPVGTSLPDTTLLESAKRELKEETGYTSSKWLQLSTMQGLKGLANQTITTFMAQDITLGESAIEHDEGIDGLRFISMKNFFSEVRNGTITDEETIAAVAVVAAQLRLV